MAQKAKCLTRKISHLRKKRATGRSNSYEKRKKEYKDKVCEENARGKVIEKLEFIENGQCFQIFLSLFFSEIERNFFDIS